MGANIRNLDKRLYRRLRAHALAAGMTVGQAVNAAMLAYLARPKFAKRGSILDLEPEPFPRGNARLSERVDTVAYGG